MTNGRIRRPCPRLREYGACGEPATFAPFGARVLDRLAMKEAHRQAKLRERAEAEAREYRYLRDRHQRSEGWDANGSPVAEAAPAPRWLRPPQRRLAMPTILALAMMAVMPDDSPAMFEERRRR